MSPLTFTFFVTKLLWFVSFTITIVMYFLRIVLIQLEQNHVLTASSVDRRAVQEHEVLAQIDLQQNDSIISEFLTIGIRTTDTSLRHQSPNVLQTEKDRSNSVTS